MKAKKKSITLKPFSSPKEQIISRLIDWKNHHADSSLSQSVFDANLSKLDLFNDSEIITYDENLLLSIDSQLVDVECRLTDFYQQEADIQNQINAVVLEHNRLITFKLEALKLLSKRPRPGFVSTFPFAFLDCSRLLSDLLHHEIPSFVHHLDEKLFISNFCTKHSHLLTLLLLDQRWCVDLFDLAQRSPDDFSSLISRIISDPEFCCCVADASKDYHQALVVFAKFVDLLFQLNAA